MTMRTRRFFGVVEALGSRLVGTGPPDESGLNGTWREASGEHPIDGHRMGLVSGLRQIHLPLSWRELGSDMNRAYSTVAVTATKATGEAAELSCGVLLEHQLRDDPRFALAPSECIHGVYCPETSEAHRGTAQIRAGWKLDPGTAAAGVERFRGRPGFGGFDQIAIFLEGELPVGFREGAAERPEAALTARASAWHVADTVTFGVPWMHRNGERLVTFELEQIRQASLHAAALVA